MFIDTDDKTIAFHPQALDRIRAMLGEIERDIRLISNDDEAISKVRAIHQILMPGFGKAARVTPMDGNDSGNLWVSEHADRTTATPSYGFAIIRHSNGQYGVHS